MTAQELQYQFGIQLNQFDSALVLSSDDINYWLNKAQDRLIKSRFEVFDQQHKSRDDLRILIKNFVELNTTYDYVGRTPRGFFNDSALLPSDTLYVISSQSKIIYNFNGVATIIVEGKRTVEDETQLVASNRVVQLDDIYAVLSDPFATTKVDNPVATFSNEKINVFTDNKFIVDKVYIDYIRTPVKIDVNNNVTSELHDHLHLEFITLGVDLFLTNTRELKQRLQRETPINDNNSNEMRQDNE